jgi:hypothetical protein
MKKNCPGGIRLPSDFRSERTIAKAAKRHCTAYTVIGSNPGVRMQAESHLELVNLLVMNAQLEVENIFDQVRFHWIGVSEKVREHVFDYVAHVRGGSKVAFAVKPKFRAKNPEFVKQMQEVAWFSTQSGFCDEVRILTEHSADRIEKRNAQLLWAVRHPMPSADEVAWNVIQGLLGAASLSDLTIKTGLGADGWRALVRLVSAGRLVPLNHEIIDPRTLVQRRG